MFCYECCIFYSATKLTTIVCYLDKEREMKKKTKDIFVSHNFTFFSGISEQDIFFLNFFWKKYDVMSRRFKSFYCLMDKDGKCILYLAS